MIDRKLDILEARLQELGKKVLELDDEKKSMFDQILSIKMRVDKLEKRARQPPVQAVDQSEKWFVICRDDNGGLTFATRRWFESSQLATAYANTVAQSRGAFVIYCWGIPGYEEHTMSYGKEV
jgi:hypothetical protein